MNQRILFFLFLGSLTVPLATETVNAPAITWISTPVWPGDTMMINGAYFTSDCLVNVTEQANPDSFHILNPLPNQTSSFSIKTLLPLTVPIDAYSIVIVCPSSGTISQPTYVNIPQAWWFQGDVGNASTTNGWLRIFGPVIALQPPASLGLEKKIIDQMREVRDRMTAPGMGADIPWRDENSSLITDATELLFLRNQLNSLPKAGEKVVVRLTPVSSSSILSSSLTSTNAIYINAAAGNASIHSAFFRLPPTSSLPVGLYSVAFANGYGIDNDPNAPQPGMGTFVNVSFFENAARPFASTIQVQLPKTWPAGIFPVTVATDPCILPCNTSDASLRYALSQAEAAGGGTVYFPPGRYYFSQPIVVPPNTVLKGASAKFVAIWFSEANRTNAPPIYIQMNDTLARTGNQAPSFGSSPAGEGKASWGIADLTLYITGFHNNVIYVNNATDGWQLTGCRFRINPYTFTWGPMTSSRGRVTNFTDQELGNVIDLHGMNNVITDNDLYATGVVITSFAPGIPGDNGLWPSPFICQGWRRGFAYAYIARNVIYNGLASHFMQLWKQAIFEQNTVMGATENAGGQSLGTGPMGGVAAHIYHGDNVIRFTFGGDREVMTTDDAGGFYFGPITRIENGTVLTFLHDAVPASDWEMGALYGAQITILNGTGRGQIRRVTVPGVNISQAITNRTWVISEPYDVQPDLATPESPFEGSYVELFPFRGRNIFHRDYNIDTGPFQFYGHAVENLVTDVKFERIRGMMNWGQWRGNFLPSSDEATAVKTQLGGQMNNGMQPNLKCVYENVQFLEGNHLFNYNCNQSGYVENWSGASIVMYPVTTLNQSYNGAPTPTNTVLVFRRSNLTSSGYYIGDGTVDVIIDHSVSVDMYSPCITEKEGGISLIYISPDFVCNISTRGITNVPSIDDGINEDGA